MPVKIIEPTASAYPYPLLIKHLLHTPMVRSPDQEIVYRDLRRRTYRAFRERIGRLASGLTQIGVEQGDVVAVFDWDSDRYHECYFAVPMMGAILQTINVSLTPDDIAYMLNDTRASTILFNVDFLPLIEKIKDRLSAAKTFVVMHDRPHLPSIELSIQAEYETLLTRSIPLLPVSGFRRERLRDDFPHHGNDGAAKGRSLQSSSACAAHSGGTRRIRAHADPGPIPSRRRLHADDANVPRSRLGLSLYGDARWSKLVFPGRYSPEIFLKLIQTERVTFTHCVPTILQMLLGAPGSEKVDLSGLKMVVGGSAAAFVSGAGGDGARHRRFLGLWPLGIRAHADRGACQVAASWPRLRGGGRLSHLGGHRRTFREERSPNELNHGGFPNRVCL